MPLGIVVSAGARQAISAAFKELEATITPADSRGFSTTTLQNVKDEVLKIERELAARQCLRNMRRLGPLFKGLEHYAKVVDVLCNGTPFLPWIWAPITLILRIASDYVEAFEQILRGYDRIAQCLGRFSILGDAFKANQEFQQILAVFYTDILEFHKHAYQFVKRSGWRLLFLTSWGRFQRRFDHILEDMKRHEDLVDKAAHAHDILESKRAREETYTWREKSMESLTRIENEQTSRRFEYIVSCLKADETDQLAILDTTTTEGLKYPGTCNWALKNAKIRSFLQPKSTKSILWLQGTPGSGKTVLCSQIINFMKKSNMPAIYHFCAQAYTSSTTYAALLRSLLLQLIRTDDEFVEYIHERFASNKLPLTQLTLENLLQKLLTVSCCNPIKDQYVWIVIDGIDELEPAKLNNVVGLLNLLTSKSSVSVGMNCKVLVSSRPSNIGISKLRNKQLISLTEEKDNVAESIRIYSATRLRSLYGKFEQINITARDVTDIESEITRKADGMFLYARLVLDYLSTNIFFNVEEVKNSVHELPAKLSQFYHKILTQILVRLDSRSVDRVKCVLGWVAFAKRPLKRMEFLSAISYSSGDSAVTVLAPKHLLEICGALIEERPNTTLSFIHVSVKEFLQSPSSNLVIVEEACLFEHGIATITCLLAGVNTFAKPNPGDTKYLRTLKGLHGFHIYANEYWTDYLLHHVISDSFDNLNSPLLSLARRLADEFDQIIPGAVRDIDVLDKELKDDKLDNLPDVIVRKHVKLSLRARSLKRLEHQPDGQEGEPRRLLAAVDVTKLDIQLGTEDEPGVPVSDRDAAEVILSNYQATVRYLLDQVDYPGVTSELLETFKSQFRASAFTCRLKGCPRATIGFESEHLYHEHELTHARRLRCVTIGCHYPAFATLKALRNHVNKHHASQPTRKTIRRTNQKLSVQLASQDGVQESANATTTRSEVLMEAARKATLAAGGSTMYSTDDLNAIDSQDSNRRSIQTRPEENWWSTPNDTQETRFQLAYMRKGIESSNELIDFDTYDLLSRLDFKDGEVSHEEEASSSRPRPTDVGTELRPIEYITGPINDRNSIFSIPETTRRPRVLPNSGNIVFGNSSEHGSRITAQSPDDNSEDGVSDTAEQADSLRNISNNNSQVKKHIATAHNSGIALPISIPSTDSDASFKQIIGPNPPHRRQYRSPTTLNRLSPVWSNTKLYTDTPVSAPPSQLLENEFLPSPSGFYPDWNFQDNKSSDFATPSVETAPSFLKDNLEHNTTTRKEPEIRVPHSSSGDPIQPSNTIPRVAKAIRVHNRELFYSTIAAIASRWQPPLDPIPTLASRPLDLIRLFETVGSFGGYDVTSFRQIWGIVGETMGFPGQFLSNILQDLYRKYLLELERNWVRPEFGGSSNSMIEWQ